MLRFHPVLKEIIFRKADNEGLSHTKLSALIGDENTAKGSARLADFRHTGRILNERLEKLIRALKITEAEVNAALCEETIGAEERSLAEWKERVRVPSPDTSSCNNCVFRSRKQSCCCEHPMLVRPDRVLRIAKWLGYDRPEWCPVRYGRI